MNDRELLYLAAKAAGADWAVEEDGRFEILSEIGGVSGFWNPLTDDGDALRLAVKLGLQITVCRNDKTFVERDHAFAEEGHGDDSMDATRRAITRAAAQLAKGAEK